eukprot:scaffold91126_cov20-Tisochrysis_lutea.AAC.2
MSHSGMQKTTFNPMKSRYALAQHHRSTGSILTRTPNKDRCTCVLIPSVYACLTSPLSGLGSHTIYKDVRYCCAAEQVKGPPATCSSAFEKSHSPALKGLAALLGEVASAAHVQNGTAVKASRHAGTRSHPKLGNKIADLPPLLPTKEDSKSSSNKGRCTEVKDTQGQHEH